MCLPLIASGAQRARQGRLLKLQCWHVVQCGSHGSHCAHAYICCALVLCPAETKLVQKIFSARHAFGNAAKYVADVLGGLLTKGRKRRKLLYERGRGGGAGAAAD